LIKTPHFTLTLLPHYLGFVIRLYCAPARHAWETVECLQHQTNSP